MMRHIVSIIVFCFVYIASLWADESRYASQSLLSSGRWVKIKVEKSGVYRLTAADLKKMGFTDLSKVSIHGYGGWILDENFSKAGYLDDVPSVPVWTNGNALFFYAKGPVKWEYDSRNDSFVHTNNPYSVAGYYFVTDATDTNSIKELPSVEGAVRQINTFDDYQLWEKDEVSVNESGRELFGESFISTTTRNFSFTVPNITSDNAKVSLRFISKAIQGSTFVTLSTNDSTLIKLAVPANGVNDTYTKAVAVFRMQEWIGKKSEKTTFTVNYGRMGDQNVYLDYIRFQMRRSLQMTGNQMAFRSTDAINNVSRFQLSGSSAATVVWDITDAQNPLWIDGNLKDSNFSFSISASDKIREFIAFDKDKLTDSPTIVGEINPQDLHGLGQYNMVIIAPELLTSEAERLAEAHHKHEGLNTIVVNPEAIYNEFSSGTPDATAYRRFLKMLYDRSTEEMPLKYLLLFGDGSFDNRGLTREWSMNKSLQKNMLLTYQSANSVDIDSYTTDDYFGFLEDGSGALLNTSKMSIGIGRFPVRTTAEASATVSKVIEYMENSLLGCWKNNVTFVADDGGNADEDKLIHMRQADQIAEIINSQHPEFKVNKLYMDAFMKDRTGGNASYPDVRNALQKQLKNGLMVVNYTGHGNTTSWADEAVLTQSDIQQATYPYLPLWITATCDFSRFDALATSAGESAFLNAKSGSIALFSTTRAVYPEQNVLINRAIINNLFTKDKEGHYLTLGEVMKASKASLGYNKNKLNFILIGDPALRLNFPDYKVVVTEINGEPVNGLLPPTLKALEKVTIKGEVHSPNGEKDATFNGLLNATILDSRQTITTLDNFNTGKKFQYTDYPNTLYVGKDSVRQGEFSITFTVPKDISYSNDYGKMNFYAVNEKDTAEAQGSFLNFKVGGTSEQGDEDNEGPEIRYLYLNDTTFTDGGKVNATPLLVVSLWDKSGINMTGSSIGHDIMLTIDNQTSKSYNLNEYYQVTGTDGSGMIIFSIPELAAGKHTAEFKVWDVLNNSTTHTFTFEVVANMKPELIKLYAAPTPAKNFVTFYMFHNLPGSELDVKLEVFDMTGRLRWSHEERGSSDAFKAYELQWNLFGNGNARLRPGVYIYRASLRYGNSKSVTEAKKMIILAQ